MVFDLSSFPEDLLGDLLIRVLDQRALGATPVPVHLPASKDEFPKLLCLDLNKWVDLGRAHYGRTDGEPFQDALASVRQAVDAGKLVVPITAENAVEATNGKDDGRRRRLAEFMVGLSKNHSICIRSSWRHSNSTEPSRRSTATKQTNPRYDLACSNAGSERQ